MRLMFSLMSQVSSKISQSIQEKIKNGASEKFDFRNLSRTYAVDMIATTAFGLEINSFENPNSEFMINASKATNFTSFSSALKFAGFFLCKPLMKFLRVKLISQKITNYFKNLFLQTMRIRQKQGIVRHDFIDLMIQVKKGTLNNDEDDESYKDEKHGFAAVEEHEIGKSKVKRQWDDQSLVSQSFGFFFAGFETVTKNDL